MEQVAPDNTQEERVCRVAQSRDLLLARAVDRYRLLDPKQKYVGVANGTLDEIEAQLRSGLKSVVDSRENKIKIEWTSGD
jgi:hypothetical protein